MLIFDSNVKNNTCVEVKPCKFIKSSKNIYTIFLNKMFLLCDEEQWEKRPDAAQHTADFLKNLSTHPQILAFSYTIFTIEFEK